MALTITDLPDAPSKLNDSPYEFSQKADAWVAAMATFTTEANALAAEAESNAAAAESEADAAAVSAAAAAASAATALAAPGTSATSSTSVVIGTGSKSLTIQTGKSLVAGMKIICARASYEATYWMYGTITSYNAGTGALVFTSEAYVGSGTYAAWYVSLTGPGSAVDDTPVNGSTGASISSNWAYDHAGSAATTNIHLGVGQTWTNVGASRAFSTNYTNNTGKPIMVAVSFVYSTKPNSYQIYVGGVQILYGTVSDDAGATFESTSVTFIVPIGAVYQVKGTNLIQNSWFELR